MKVLVVEDNPLNMTLLCSSLTDRLGCEVISASEGRQALERLRNHTDIGLVITDLHMPGFHGLLLMEHMKENPKWARIPIIVCTSDSSRDTVLKVANLGVHHFLCKPVRMSMLKGKMQEALSESPVSLSPRLKLMLQLDIDLTELAGLHQKAQEKVIEVLRTYFTEKPDLQINETGIEELALALWPSVFKERIRKVAS